jgi:hypothetical protein
LHRKGEKEREADGREREDPYLKVRQLELVGACLPSSLTPGVLTFTNSTRIEEEEEALQEMKCSGNGEREQEQVVSQL